ncbi:2,4-dienoyl-CoA reductase [(3E)-enoyl-CoA-producing], mitochondrial [Hydra vulgaris]|nr:2,4-dienoyl-CoA reductase [(3E)-enoyl-CoA-producing], mitochondrial [Hydra vulgaris]
MSSKFPALLKTMLPNGTFNGKVAFITGGGTGLGKGMAKVLSQLGATVVIASRKLLICQNAAEEISSLTGNKVLPLELDVRKPESVKLVVDTIEKELGLPTIVINNAAGNFISPFERLSANAFRNIVDIVLNGTANVTLDVGKRLIKAQKGGVFLSITTWYADLGSGYVVPSACAKAGVDAMVKSLSSEWGKYGIRLNAIAPGSFQTEGAFSRLDPTGKFMEAAKEKIIVKRFGEIEELANLVSYIVSDYASFMNGEIVCFDGGERRSYSGMFNELNKIPEDQWDLLEGLIRSKNKSKL